MKKVVLKLFVLLFFSLFCGFCFNHEDTTSKKKTLHEKTNPNTNKGVLTNNLTVLNGNNLAVFYESTQKVFYMIQFLQPVQLPEELGFVELDERNNKLKLRNQSNNNIIEFSFNNTSYANIYGIASFQGEMYEENFIQTGNNGASSFIVGENDIVGVVCICTSNTSSNSNCTAGGEGSSSCSTSSANNSSSCSVVCNDGYFACCW